jgi:hypothetical protein
MQSIFQHFCNDSRMGHSALHEQCDPTERQGDNPAWGEKDIRDHWLSPWSLAQDLQGQSLTYDFFTWFDVQWFVLNWVVVSSGSAFLWNLMNRGRCYCTMGTHHRWKVWTWRWQYWGPVAPVGSTDEPSCGHKQWQSHLEEQSQADTTQASSEFSLHSIASDCTYFKCLIGK